jgi:putative transposase
MPRPRRLNIPGLPQHLVQRGNNRQACFQDEADYRRYLNLLGIACKRHDCEVHAYVLMTNHVHILLTPHQPDGASLVFRDLGRDYVRRFNRRHQRTGTLWEGRFRSSPVDSDRYLLTCYRYIELNPVRAGLVDQPAQYPWSSFHANALGFRDRLLTPHGSWLLLGADNSSRRNAYLSLFDSVLDADQLEIIRKGLNKGLPTGNNGFRLHLERIYSVKFGMGKKGRPRIRE